MKVPDCTALYDKVWKYIDIVYQKTNSFDSLIIFTVQFNVFLKFKATFSIKLPTITYITYSEYIINNIYYSSFKTLRKL